MQGRRTAFNSLYRALYRKCSQFRVPRMRSTLRSNLRETYELYNRMRSLSHEDVQALHDIGWETVNYLKSFDYLPKEDVDRLFFSTDNSGGIVDLLRQGDTLHVVESQKADQEGQGFGASRCADTLKGANDSAIDDTEADEELRKAGTGNVNSIKVPSIVTEPESEGGEDNQHQ